MDSEEGGAAEDHIAQADPLAGLPCCSTDAGAPRGSGQVLAADDSRKRDPGRHRLLQR
jgi:hypothetical protein